MKNILSNIVGLVIILLVPLTASSQNWTAEQQEVIDQIETCYDAWVKAVEEKNYDVYLEACPCDKDIVRWHPDYGLPPNIGIDVIRRQFEYLISTGFFTKVEWLQLHPSHIRIEGDVALVYLYAVLSLENGEGEVIIHKWRRLTVLVKKDGQWTMLGTMWDLMPSD